MPIGRRLRTLLLVLALIGAPAVALRVLCVGHSCDASEAAAQDAVPFCPLPAELRREIAAGFREGRSPDVMASTIGASALWTRVQDDVHAPWPGAARIGGDLELPDTRVPIALFGVGVRRRAPLPDGVGLDAIAPTLEAVTGIRRDHPDVRTGTAVENVASEGVDAPPLVVMIAWKGVGTPDLEARPDAWPFLRRAIRDGAGTLEAVTGSLPLDPAATLTTIGTGALPSSHGITGTLVRDDDGHVQRAWSTREAGSVIATFADDIDRDTAQRSVVTGVLTDPADRGLIGDGWYLDGSDRDTVAQIGRGPDRVHSTPARLAAAMVATEGLGRDRVTDLLALVLDGTVDEVDTASADVVGTIRELVPDTTFAVAGTGSLRGVHRAGSARLATAIDAALQAPVVEGTSAGGFFLDGEVLVERSLSAQRVADTLRREGTSDAAPMFGDVYPSFAVAFSRYC